MKLKDIMIGVVLFSVFVVAAYAMMGGLYGSYGTSFDNKSESFNYINNMTVLANGMQNQTQGSAMSDFGFALGAWTALNMMFQTPGVILALINEISADFGIPNYFAYAAIAIATITILFAILSSVFRRST